MPEIMGPWIEHLNKYRTKGDYAKFLRPFHTLKSIEDFPSSEDWHDAMTEYYEPRTQEIIDNWVPWELEHVVCKCITSHYYSPEGKYNNSFCYRCNKLARHMIFICRECGEKFIHNYTWPGMTTKDKRFCFDCMVKKHGMVEGARPSQYQARPRRSMDEIMTDAADLDFDF